MLYHRMRLKSVHDQPTNHLTFDFVLSTNSFFMYKSLSKLLYFLNKKKYLLNRPNHTQQKMQRQPKGQKGKKQLSSYLCY